MPKEFMFRGKTIDELKKMSIKDFAALLKARDRRSLLRGLTEQQKCVIEKLKKNQQPETHSREMIILPEMVNKTVKVHNGKNFVSVAITNDMLGHRLGKFALTRKRVEHHAPGIGATRSSASLSVK